MLRTVTAQERRDRLARRHLLLPDSRVDDVATVADALVALHSTDPVTVHLSAAARMRSPSIAAVEQALYDDRAVVRHHAMRRTLWVATPPVARRMHAAATRRLVGPERRRLEGLLAANDVEDPRGWVAHAAGLTLETLREHGPMTARSLGTAVPELRRQIVMAPGKKWTATVSAHTRVLTLLGFEGRLLRGRPAGSWVSGAYAYAAADAWLDGGLGDIAEAEAARDLATHWLRAFGPGTSTDLQWWMGWTGATTTRALRDCGAFEVGLDGGTGWVAPGDDEPVEPAGAWVALLPGLDPTTMGWKEREWYLPPAAAAAFDRMGNAGPTVWVDGQVVGVWVQRPDGEIRTHLLTPVTPSARAAVEQEAERLAALVGDTRFTVRFPSPLLPSLLA